MGVHHLAAVYDLGHLNASRKSILYSLAVAGDIDGNAALDRVGLGKAAGLKERALRDNLRWLRSHGYIAISGEPGCELITLDFGR